MDLKRVNMDGTFQEMVDDMNDNWEKIENGLQFPITRYGVRRAHNQTSAVLERLGNAVGMVANADNSLTSYNVVQNDFDNVYPWSHIRNCKITEDGKIVYENDPSYDLTDGDWMVEIPSFYLKHTSNETHAEYWISATSGAEFDKIDKFWVGRFPISAGYRSTIGTLPLVSINLTNFRNGVVGKGDKWQLLDLMGIYVIQVLYQIEFANLNSQLVLGNGVTSTDSAKESGRTLALISSSGQSVGTNGNESISYRGIEDIFGNVYQWIDGLLINDHQAYVCVDPSKYSSTLTSDYHPLSYVNIDSNGYPLTMGYDNYYKFAQFPITFGGSTTTGYCDYYYQNVGLRAARFGGAWTAGSAAGVFFWSLTVAPSSTGANLGSRLLKKP